MGSSPVTATKLPPSSESVSSRLRETVAGFLSRLGLRPGDGIAVAFSGGPDSTALLWAVKSLANELALWTVALHLDHGLDPGSADRAVAAARIAHRLEVDCVTERREVEPRRQPGESPEAAARRVRYQFLEEKRAALGARFLATGHHRDDQAETVAMRLVQGSGLLGLAGLQEIRGSLVRPLLGLDRATIAEALRELGLDPLDDPTNRSLTALRNRARWLWLPHLEATHPGARSSLASLAAAAAGARARLRERLLPALSFRHEDDGVSVSRQAFLALPPGLRSLGLGLAQLESGASFPASRAATLELAAQLARPGRVGCDAGHGFRWESRRGRLVLLRPAAGTPAFSYTLTAPGEVFIPELAARLRFSGPMRGSLPPSEGELVYLNLPLEPGSLVEIRNRRPGDRFRPAGTSRSQRLKEILIDRAVPRRQRDRLPILVVDGTIVWIAGLGQAHETLPGTGRQIWQVELQYGPAAG